MKQLSNGVIAYYPSETMQKIISLLMCLVGVALVSPLLPGKDGRDWIVALVILVSSIFLIRDAFFKPICLVYPEKIEWYSREFIFYTPNTLTWEQISEFYLNEESVKRGREYLFVKVLILKTSDESFKMKRFYSLSKQDRENLLNELRARGIPQESDRND